ncbi:histidine phosphatase family protein [Risungbinella massiliensis]|uniref:histidine phosphatase family protein n=1 Tax=Risungbinella massiliensis TaxID=1329796 RepID=UPI0005CC45E7|nr:histidine phosphatase family protein [Risungbinella massiliensis]
MNTNLYLVRHGQTKWNVEGRLQGRLDSSLTEIGIEQAKQLAQRINDVPFKCIYSSSASRAVETALYLKGGRSIDLVKTDSLMEMSFSKWEGRKWSEIQEMFPKALEEINNNPENYDAKESQGETLLDVQERSVPFIRDILERHVGENILVVTHSIVIKVLVNYFRGGSIKTVWEGPDTGWASVFQLCFNSDGVKIFYEGSEVC